MEEDHLEDRHRWGYNTKIRHRKIIYVNVSINFLRQLVGFLILSTTANCSGILAEIVYKFHMCYSINLKFM